MAALLEAVAASPSDVAIGLSKEIDWIRVRKEGRRKMVSCHSHLD